MTPNLNLSVHLLESYLSTRGYSIEKLTLDSQKYTRFLPSSGSPWLVRNGSITYPFLSRTCLRISRRKDLAHTFCKELGVRVPTTFTLSGPLKTAELQRYLMHAPLVVKPHNGAMSKGVTLGVNDMPALLQAITVARGYSDTILVQEQIAGEEIRFVVVDARVRAALLRQTPRIVGNGQDTVQQLIEKENHSRGTLRMPYVNYPALKSNLLDLDFVAPTYVPAANELVELGKGTMIKTGASVYDVHDRVHESYEHVAEKLATKLGARFIVVDMIIEDFEQSLSNSNYAFLEFNTAPALKMFYSCRDGKHFDALSHLEPIITESLQVA